MRKYSRLLSLVLLIATLFSLTSVAAFAASDENSTVVFDTNGSDVTGGSSNGSVVISAEDDAKLISGTSTSSSDDEDDEDTEESVPVEAGSQYSIMTTSASALDYFSSEEMLNENPMVYYNAKYIVYIREHMDELKETNPAVVETAYELFGAEIMDMTFEKTTTVVSKSVALKAQADSLQSIITALEALVDDPADADGILALRKATNSYSETFEGVANYDYTDAESAFDTVDEALEAAKAELENINAEIEKLASEDEEETEAKAEATPTPTDTPVPTITPTANEAIEETTAPETTETEEVAETADTTETTTEEKVISGDTAVVAMATAPFKFFESLFAAPAYDAYSPSYTSLVGQTKTLDSTITITGLPEWPIVVCLDNAVLTSPYGAYAFEVNDSSTVVTIEACTIYGSAIKVSAGNVTLKDVNAKCLDKNYYPVETSDAMVYVTGGRLEIGNCELEASEGCAVSCIGGTLAINGYNKISSSDPNRPAVYVDNCAATIDATGTTQSIISNTSYIGLDICGASVDAFGNAKISGLTGVYVASGSFCVNDSVRIDGVGRGQEYAAINNDGGKVYVSGGELYAEYCTAVLTNKDNGAITYVANGEDIIKTSKYDCYDQYDAGIITINDAPFVSVEDANTELANGEYSEEENAVVRLLGDVKTDVPLTIPSGVSASILGDGHSIVSTSNAIAISGTATVNNIVLQAADNYCIYVTGSGAYANIGSGTVAKASATALYADDGATVVVNGMTMYGTNGVYAVDNNDSDLINTKVTITSCKNNATNPIAAGTDDSLEILAGYFLNLGSENVALVEDYLASGSEISEKSNSDGYYVVTMDNVPTVAVVNGTTGTDANGIPYVVYDKSNPKYLTFDVDPKVVKVNAVPINGGLTVNIFKSQKGVDGDISIDVDAFQNNIPSGVYDLQFEFKNGYVMTDKIHLYVLPELVKLVARADYLDASPDNLYAITKASDITTDVSSYIVGSKAYIYAKVSELPDKIGVSSDPNGNDVSWFGYYPDNDKDLAELIATDTKVLTMIDDGYYYILLDYAFLDQMPAGQDYVFLDYDGAIKRVDLKIVNNNVTITPTYVDFFGADTQIVFTVTPDYKDVYIGGQLVPTQYVKYDTTTHKLTINGEFLKSLESGEHLVEVETSWGWVSATVRTGVGLKPIDVDYHVYGGSKALAFEASDEIDTSAGIYIGKNNPTKVDSTLIYFYDNNTKFTLSPSYLNRLSLGTYYISAYVWNGDDYEYTSTTFRIVSASSAAYNPGTGDTFNPVLWIGIAVLAAAVIVVILVPTLKKRNAAKAVAATAAAVTEEVKEKATEATENKDAETKENKD